MKMEKSLNVFDEPLIQCGDNPTTGFYRDGCCNTSMGDAGSHTVCVRITQEFLEFSRFRGNDLITPSPKFEFPGLKPGDNWCLCASRWLQAYENRVAPHVYLTRTHKRALEIVHIDKLKEHSLDIS
ncbi:MAG: DUF2237 domain-containing protein [Gammaproteobacteria bacterium]|nr:DUF2237 domain-containing protein [Gammaproteobacteria bacterium]